MTSTVRRAGAFAVVGSLALAVPLLTAALDRPVATLAAAAPFVLVAVAGLYAVGDGTIFELFARPSDRRDGRLYGLAGFALATAGLSLLTTSSGMPPAVFVASVLLVSYGNLAGHLVRAARDEPVLATAGFVVVGALAGSLGALLTQSVVGQTLSIPIIAFLVASGALTAALLRTMLFERDDPIVLVTVGLLLWLFTTLGIEASATRVGIALAVTVALGYLSYALDTASLPGMLTGVLLGLLTIVVGDYGWFAMLITFFAVGGLSSKLKYDLKAERGIAEPNDGARGSGNVLANSLMALFAVLAHGARTHVGLPDGIFLFIFAGSVAAAMSDTLSSEVGGLYDDPRLITTLEVVDPGTDGAVTWQGELAGLAGALLIAGICATFFDIGAVGIGVVVLAGIAGMTVDSLLGATVEGDRLGNQSVNFLATVAAGIFGGAVAVVVLL